MERKLAVRPSDKANRNSVIFSKKEDGTYLPREIPASAFIGTLYELFGWKVDCKYRIIGSLYETANEMAYIFDAVNTEAFFKSYVMPVQQLSPEGTTAVQPLTPSGKRIRAIPKEWVNEFGELFYLQERSLSALESQSEEDWKLYMEGRLFESGKQLKVTGFDELQRYIKQELRILARPEVNHE